jgi:predicted transcriptional regulator
MKRDLVEDMILFLVNQGYILKNMDSGFDVLARKKDKTLLIKVVKDANSLNPEMVYQMKNIASYINGVPMILAESAGNMLEDNVVYSRNGVVTLNLETLKGCVKANLPYVKSSKAGLIVSIDGGELKKLREESGYSLNTLAKKVGVTSRMVARYENENADVSFINALKIYDLFGDSVFNCVDVFSRPTIDRIDASSDISLKYAQLGFNVLETIRSPFNIVARKEKEIILTSVGDKVSKHVNSLSKLLDADNLLVFNHRKPKVDMPVIAKDEFLEFEKSNEILKFLKEF